tara:strand:- start:545 stop:919 length:375 start_codon:yes stop_codon:yes gene_type:complete
MKKLIFSTASILGFMSIVLGAFGAHILEDHLILSDTLNTFETAVKYQFYHVFFLMILGLCYDQFDTSLIKYAFFSVLMGVFLFSGSLYVLCFTNNNMFGALTPFGGFFLIIAWLLFLFSIRKSL